MAGTRRTSRKGEASGQEARRDQSAPGLQDVIRAALGAAGGLGYGRPLAVGGGRGPRWLRRLPCGQVNRDRASAQGGSCGAGGLRTGQLIWELPGLGGGWTWRVREEGDR